MAMSSLRTALSRPGRMLLLATPVQSQAASFANSTACRAISWRSVLYGQQGSQSQTNAEQTQNAANNTNSSADAGAANGTAAQPSPQVAEMEQKIKALTEELANTKDKYLRSLAEVDNIQKRSVVEVQRAKDHGIQKFAKDLVPVADDLQRALDSVPAAQRADASNPNLVSLYEGLTMIHTTLLKAFSDNGLKQNNPLGHKFDPNLHQAMYEIPAPEGKEPSTVGDVRLVGYVLNGRLIRPAQVGVFRKA